MVGRDRPALRGRGFELLLSYNWIKKGGGSAVVWPLASWGRCNSRLQFVPTLSSVCGCRDSVSHVLLFSNNF